MMEKARSKWPAEYAQGINLVLAVHHSQMISQTWSNCLDGSEIDGPMRVSKSYRIRKLCKHWRGIRIEPLQQKRSEKCCVTLCFLEMRSLGSLMDPQL